MTIFPPLLQLPVVSVQSTHSYVSLSSGDIYIALLGFHCEREFHARPKVTMDSNLRKHKKKNITCLYTVFALSSMGLEHSTVQFDSKQRS